MSMSFNFGDFILLSVVCDLFDKAKKHNGLGKSNLIKILIVDILIIILIVILVGLVLFA